MPKRRLKGYRGKGLPYKRRPTFITTPMVVEPHNIAKRGLMLNKGEFKSILTQVNMTVDSTSAVLLLNGIARGDDIGERVGRQVVIKSIELKMTSMVNATDGTDQIHRIFIVYDKQTNATALTYIQVLNSLSVHAPRNLENRNRFVNLYDRYFSLTNDGNYGCRRSLQHYKRHNLKVTFNSGDAGTVADIVTGSIYLCCMGTNVAGVTAATLLGYVRLRFQDI